MKNDESTEKAREEALARFKTRSEGGIVEGGEPYTPDYAGFWRRFVAWFIDAIIVGIFGGIFVGILSVFSPQGGSLISNIIGIVYILAFWTLWGQTLGKMAMSVKIVKTDGSPIGFGTAVLRYIGYFISFILLLIGYLMIAFDGKKQGLHDKIAGTYVIKT